MPANHADDAWRQIRNYFAFAVDGVLACPSDLNAGRDVAVAVLVVEVEFSTTRIGCRSAGSDANLAELLGTKGPSAETDCRAPAPVATVLTGEGLDVGG